MEKHAPRSRGNPVSGHVLAAEQAVSARQADRSWRRTFLALRRRNYRLYWCGQLISQAGTMMQTIGQAWLVLELTQSAWQLGLVGALQALPILLFSLFGGVFADRWSKRRVLLITQSVAMLQALLLWILLVSGTLRLWELYGLVLVPGMLNSLGRPASRAFIVEMVGREDLPNAVALNSALSTLARIAGPALGGVIIAVSSVTTLFLLNALSFLPVVAALILMRSHELYIPEAPLGKEHEHQNAWQRLREGLRYIRATPVVLLLILVVGLVLLFGSNFNVVLPLFATDILRVGAAGFGLLSAATGIGALLAALWLAWRNRQPAVRTILNTILLFGLLEAIFAVSSFYPLSLVLIAGVGFTENIFAMQALTILQIITPQNLSGRVMSVQVLFFDGSLPLGYLLMGWLAGLWGAPLALLGGALLSVLAASLLVSSVRRERANA